VRAWDGAGGESQIPRLEYLNRAGATNADLLALVRRGECEELELKPFVEPESEKFDEIRRTVFAFANGGGGLIVVGVDDDCQVIGLNRGTHTLQRWAKSDDAEALERYRGAVQGRIGENANRSPPVVVRKSELDGHGVLLVDVRPGEDPPYYDTRNNTAYIRRGSSNLKMTPDEVKVQFGGSATVASMSTITG
jgi:predicted HTH transcriptional regulator